MAITLTLADAYFGTHVQGTAWNDFEATQRERAVIHAKRLISARVDDFTDDTTADGDAPRYDLAVYEQAFWMLSNSDLPRDGDTGAPRYLSNDGETYAEPVDINTLCPSCTKWIVGSGVPYPLLEMSRG